MSEVPLVHLIRAEMQRFSGRQYQIAFDRFDAKSLQELLRFLLDAENEPLFPIVGFPGRATGRSSNGDSKNAA